jgi:hypothetical protein
MNGRDNLQRRQDQNDQANVVGSNEKIKDQSVRVLYKNQAAANDSRYTNSEASNDAVYNPYALRTLGARYAREDSVEALSQKNREKIIKAERERALKEFYETEQQIELSARRVESELASHAVQTISGKALSRATLRYSLWVAGVVCFWQGIFAILSLVGFGMHAYILQIRNETLAGRFVGFFFDFQNYFPGEFVGMTFWAISALIGGGAFLGYIIFFYVLGVRVMATVVGTLLMALCFALTILPIINIFPWLLLWVLYLNGATLFSKRAN